MRVVFALFDSLNRKALEPYGGQAIATPNFLRLAERALTFDRHYVGSMPCMPARRDLLTGRLSFLHRSWGPMEPFDNAFPELLKTAKVHSAIWSPTTTITGRTAAPPTTIAIRPSTSSAARRAIRGRRWSSRHGSGCARNITSASARAERWANSCPT